MQCYKYIKKRQPKQKREGHADISRTPSLFDYCKYYKPSSVLPCGSLYHLSTTTVTRSLQQPTPRHWASNP